MEQGYGPLKISFDLAKKGVPKDIADASLQGKDWLASLTHYVQSRPKLRQMFLHPNHCKIVQKVFRHLAGRGFRYGELNALHQDLRHEDKP